MVLSRGLGKKQLQRGKRNYSVRGTKATTTRAGVGASPAREGAERVGWGVEGVTKASKAHLVFGSLPLRVDPQ